MNKLKTSDLSVAYGTGSARKVFRYRNIHCTPKTPLLVSGKSGSGKSTFLHLLGGLLKPLSGTISIDQDNIALMTSRELDRFRGKHIGIIYQKPHFFQSMRVLDNILLSAHFSGRRKPLDRALFLAERLQIETLLFRKPAELSLGEQQRVGIARALLNSPKILLADEPTSSLDHENCQKVIQLLTHESRTAGASLIVVTHDERLQTHFKNTLQLS